MDKLKKIGLTALAGSMVALSASAVEMSVSGSTEMTYTSRDGNADSNTTGDPLGMNTSLAFTGSGETDFGTLKVHRAINDGLGSALSMYNTLDMGDGGVLSFDSSGGDLTGLSAHDDTLPYAYEESWHGVGTGPLSGLTSSNVLGYKNSFGPISLELSTTKSNGAGGNGDQTSSGEGAAGGASDIVISGTMAEGLTGTIAAATLDDNSATSLVTDTKQVMATVKYTMGGMSVGVLVGEQRGGAAVAIAQAHEAMSIAYAINENLSVSYGVYDIDFEAKGNGANGAAGADIEERSKGFGLSYTMGSAKIGIAMNEASDKGGIIGKKDENLDIGLTLSF
jgi:outer membrane protein OmpU